MKVQVTVEVSDDERLAIGALKYGSFVAANRIDVREWAAGALEKELLPLQSEVAAVRDQLVEALQQPKMSLDEYRESKDK
jgi:hypothetical protein